MGPAHSQPSPTLHSPDRPRNGPMDHEGRGRTNKTSPNPRHRNPGVQRSRGQNLATQIMSPKSWGPNHEHCGLEWQPEALDSSNQGEHLAPVVDPRSSRRQTATRCICLDRFLRRPIYACASNRFAKVLGDFLSESRSPRVWECAGASTTLDHSLTKRMDVENKHRLLCRFF